MASAEVNEERKGRKKGRKGKREEREKIYVCPQASEMIKIKWNAVTVYSFLENPMDRGVWWATVYRVAKSWTRLKRLNTHAHVWFKLPFLIPIFFSS